MGLDPEETAEWLEALDQVIDSAGLDSAAYLLEQLSGQARAVGADLPIHLNTPYINTIRPEDEVLYPGDRAIERRITSFIRWNAMAMVVRQNKCDPGIGGHISTYASLATLLEVGFNHFFHARYGDQPGDLIYFQGHASPGVYVNELLTQDTSGSRANRLLTHPDGPASTSELPTIRGAFGEYGIESDNRIFQKVEERLGVAFDFDESRLRRVYEGGQSRYA